MIFSLYYQVNDVDDDAVMIVETETSPQSSDVAAKKRKTKSLNEDETWPKKRKVSKNDEEDDDICIVESNSEVEIVPALGLESNKKAPVKRIRSAADDDCLIVFDDGNCDTATSPPKKIKQSTN